MKQTVEILAPAGSFESFQAAVHAGSDAVYLGGTLFSARASADNFTKEQLFSALDYAHLHGRRVYMTVNTLLKETEIGELFEYLLPFYEHGLDAAIVQDTGVLKTVAEAFPDLPLHLSTQMTLTGSMGAGMFEKKENKYHVTRLVPARELSLEELRQLRSGTMLELEVFVHGALCVCYSGQCYLSSMIGGRSGNRGRCAQPCRKLYTSKGTAYLLSPKDLCTLEMIPDLLEAGIDSFKIEGRMKKPEYAAYISWLYRKYADRYFQYGREEYEAYFRKCPKELEDDLRGMKDLYNRGGFTKGYFISHNGRHMMSMERPNHAGVLVGSIRSVKGNTAEVLWEQEIFPQDILEIRNQGKAIYEYTVKTAQVSGERSRIRFFAGTLVKPGMEVFRTRNQALLHWIKENLSEHTMEIPLCGKFLAKAGQKALLTIWREQDTDEGAITAEGDICQKAQKQPMTEAAARKQLSRLGDTEFVWKQLEIDIGEDLFLPVKSLNELRREALLVWKERYLRQFYRKTLKQGSQKGSIWRNERKMSVEMECRKAADIPLLAAEVLTAEQWNAALAKGNVHIIYARMEILGEKEILSLAEETVQKGSSCYLSLPRVLHENKRQMAEALFCKLFSKGLCEGILLHNIEELGFAKKLYDSIEIKNAWAQGTQSRGHEIRLVADFSMYSTNSQAICFWKEQGIRRVTASIEQNSRELQELFRQEHGVETEIQVYGKLPLMVSAQCIASYGAGKDCMGQPGRTVLTDAWNEELICRNFCSFCYNILYSQKPCDLRPWAEELLELSMNAWRCSFTEETGQETREILDSLAMILNGKSPFYTEAFTGNFHKGMI